MGHSAIVSSCYDLSEVEIFGKPEQNKAFGYCAGLCKRVWDLELGNVNCKSG